MPSVLANCDAPTYLGIRKILCPYCAVPIPDTHDQGATTWTHTISGTSPAQTFNCQANALRKQRAADGANDA